MAVIRLMVTGLTAAGLLVPLSPAGPAAAAASVTPPWSVVPSPGAMAPQAQLADVSCGSATACIAVGPVVSRAGPPVALAERWNGSRWAGQSIPVPAGAVITTLTAVSCTSASACTAVGTYRTRSVVYATLAERWDGTRWAIQRTPNPGRGSALFGVSCSSAAACTAVGSSAATGGPALAERWNGTKWSVQPTPVLTRVHRLSGVSCPSARACMAVGSFQVGKGSRTVAEWWNGTKWTVQHAPSATPYTGLSAVSCSSASACTAVGFQSPVSNGGYPAPLAARWNGRTWAVQPTPTPAGNDYLTGVSCPSAAACTAVGFHQTREATNEAPMAEAWNGSRWAVTAAPRPGHSPPGGLMAVSCSAAAACTAAGYTCTASPCGNVGPGDSLGLTLAEAWNGTRWAAQPTPTPAGAQASVLSGISCTSAAACMAVGNGADIPSFSSPVTLAERWNGRRWAVTPTPRLPGTYLGNSLSAVSCTSARACTAVGYYHRPGPDGGHLPGHLAGLAERWNGTTWTVQPLPTSGEFSSLGAVSCPSATSCTAVGGGAGGILAEHWNGRRWTVEPAPTPAGGYTVTGVSCTSATACTLVGSSGSDLSQQTLAERWNGTKWVIQPTPDPSSDSYLAAVSCPSARSCTAVGWAAGTQSGVVRVTLAEHWDGSTWTVQPTPDYRKQHVNQLNGVSCVPATACAAVGSYINLLAEAWNGRRWVIQGTGRPPGAGSPILSGVSCRPAGPCTAVGNYVSARTGNYATLVERRS